MTTKALLRFLEGVQPFYDESFFVDMTDDFLLNVALSVEEDLLNGAVRPRIGPDGPNGPNGPNELNEPVLQEHDGTSTLSGLPPTPSTTQKRKLAPELETEFEAMSKRARSGPPESSTSRSFMYNTNAEMYI